MNKIDCSVTENYLKEKDRMTDNCNVGCINCPLSNANNEKNISCYILEGSYPQKSIEIVQQWSDEHPIVTNADKLKEIFPNADVKKIPPCFIGLCSFANCIDNCQQCNEKYLNAPYKEV